MKMMKKKSYKKNTKIETISFHQSGTLDLKTDWEYETACLRRRQY